MASPSEHEKKEGLRCGAISGGYVPTGPGLVGATLHTHRCPGLLLERDSVLGLGFRCDKKNCHRFHPLEVSLRRAVEQELLSPKQREAIRRAVSENPKEKPERNPEEEMTTKTKLQKDLIVSVARELLGMVQLPDHDVPDLVNVLVEHAVAENRITFCGMCVMGRLIPIVRGRVRKNPNTPSEHMVSVTIAACNNCGFLYEDTSLWENFSGSTIGPVH